MLPFERKLADAAGVTEIDLNDHVLSKGIESSGFVRDNENGPFSHLSSFETA